MDKLEAILSRTIKQQALHHVNDAEESRRPLYDSGRSGLGAGAIVHTPHVPKYLRISENGREELQYGHKSNP